MKKSIQFDIATIAILVVFFEFAILKPAHAYIDPGTGSYIFSVVVALLCGVSYAFRMFWQMIMNICIAVFIVGGLAISIIGSKSANILHIGILVFVVGVVMALALVVKKYWTIQDNMRKKRND